jgi:hypothetical protein
LSIAAVFGPVDDELPAGEPDGVPELQAARPGSPPRTPSRTTADSAVRARNLFIAVISLLRAIRFGLANYYSS